MHLQEGHHFMDKQFDEALASLSSATTMERFNAATFFIKHSDIRAREQLHLQRRIEKVRHVKLALDKALNNINKLDQSVLIASDIEVDEATDAERKRYLKAEAIDEFSGVILHELAPKLGILEDTLNLEVPSFESSKSKKGINSLMQIFRAIEQLRKSTSPPDSKEVDLAQLIKDIVAEEVQEGIRVNLEGSLPFIITSDPALLKLAISNGIRNSNESLKALS
ncbi:MAG TPA: sensor histidine kinase, partial [Shewanella frigidimarina]|nr:sensor histidine kinase [Shewanella frigidimarina]